MPKGPSTMQFELTKEYIETLRDAIERNAETSLIALVSELKEEDEDWKEIWDDLQYELTL